MCSFKNSSFLLLLWLIVTDFTTAKEKCCGHIYVWEENGRSLLSHLGVLIISCSKTIKGLVDYSKPAHIDTVISKLRLNQEITAKVVFVDTLDCFWIKVCLCKKIYFNFVMDVFFVDL